MTYGITDTQAPGSERPFPFWLPRPPNFMHLHPDSSTRGITRPESRRRKWWLQQSPIDGAL